MAYNEEVAHRVRHRLKGKVPVKELKMMGCLIFMVHDTMCLGIQIDKKSNADILMVRVGALNYKDVLPKRKGKQVYLKGELFRGFLRIESDDFDGEDDLEYWIRAALAFNKILSR